MSIRVGTTLYLTEGEAAKRLRITKAELRSLTSRSRSIAPTVLSTGGRYFSEAQIEGYRRDRAQKLLTETYTRRQAPKDAKPTVAQIDEFVTDLRTAETDVLPTPPKSTQEATPYIADVDDFVAYLRRS